MAFLGSIVHGILGSIIPAPVQGIATNAAIDSTLTNSSATITADQVMLMRNTMANLDRSTRWNIELDTEARRQTEGTQLAYLGTQLDGALTKIEKAVADQIGQVG